MAVTLQGRTAVGASTSAFRVDALPEFGSLDTTAIPEIIYTPDDDYTGPDSFTYHAVGGDRDCA